MPAAQPLYDNRLNGGTLIGSALAPQQKSSIERHILDLDIGRSRTQRGGHRFEFPYTMSVALNCKTAATGSIECQKLNQIIDQLSNTFTSSFDRSIAKIFGGKKFRDVERALPASGGPV